jgi:EmrB/QacA subfamily drug resistance transporter
MSRRQVLEAMSGLLLGLFVAILSSTVISAALPRIITDFGADQTAYTWVVASTLLALTVSTPVWGKLADRVDRKLLVQVALAGYVAGSVLAGLSTSTGFLIACRAVQGICAGGMSALVQVILADLVSPRERGRYMGVLGAVMAVGMISGPVIGGLLTDGLGWRWCFYVGVPFGLAAFVLLQRTLHLPPRPRRPAARPDLPGALLIAGGVSLVLIWVTFAGHAFAWGSWQTAAMVGGGAALLAVAVAVERRAADPLIPLELFADRTVVLAVVASVAVGVAMFGTSVFLVQYLQISQGRSPTASGLLTIPMVVGSMLSATAVGQVIARTGRYKRWMLLGAALMTAGLALMGTLRAHTSLVELGAFMALVGLGMGMLMQNLVLVAQNVLPPSAMGAGSALVVFFRSLAGAAGVSALGAVLASTATSSIADGLAARGLDAGRLASGSGALPDVHALPGPVRTVVENAYAAGVADTFLVAAPLGLVALLAVWLMREVPLGTTSGLEAAAVEAAADGQRRGEDAAAAPASGPARP